MSERDELIGRAAAAFEALADLAETVDDEWQYVTDLREAYGPAISALGDGAPLAPEAATAVEEAIAEIGLIEDPHRAIDWLSTFPHVIALAVGGDVDSEVEGRTGARNGEPDEPDDDNPFRILLGGGR